MSDSIQQLSLQDFNVRAVVTDNHASNVSAFRILKSMHQSNDVHFIEHPQSKTKNYLFVCKGFALLDFLDCFIYRQTFISTREGSLCILRYYLADFQFFCDLHLNHGKEATLKMIVNIFYNN